MLSSRSSRSSRKYALICLAVTALFCLACLFLSVYTPRMFFDVGVQGGSLVVKRVLPGYYDEGIQNGDVIERVSGQPVHTRASFYHQMRAFGKDDEVMFKRMGSRFQRPVSASEFAHGALPAGVLVNDKPVMIADESGNYTPLENVDFQTLRGILENRSGAVPVIFKRQEEVHSQGIPRLSVFSRTASASLILLLVVLMAVIVWREKWNHRNEHALPVILTLGFGTVGLMTIGLWAVLKIYPIVFMIGMIGLTLFKVVDFDYHLMRFGTGRKIELWARIALFVGPLATLLVPIWLCIRALPVMMGVDIDPDIELKLETFVFLPMLWVIIYTLVDGCVTFARRYHHPETRIMPYEIGVGIACLLSVFVFVLMRSDMITALWFLMAMILAQIVGDVVPVFSKSHDALPVRLDSPEFSSSQIRDILNRAHDLFGDAWLVQVVIDRPSPKHIVGLMRSTDDDNISGLELNVLMDSWRDFLDLMRVEGACINGTNSEPDPRDPVAGVAARLGIGIAMPIADNVAGTLTSLTLIVSSLRDPGETGAPAMALSPDQREQITGLIEDLAHCAPAMVYLSAEMSLDYVGEDLDEIAQKVHETASFARALRNPTIPLAAQELPHGLLDEDDEHDRDHEDASIVDTQHENGVDEYETRVYEEEVSFLKSQVQALYSQQMREYALSEVELTHAQKDILDDMETLDPPMLFIGEIGTGKRFLAMAAHQNRSSGPFLVMDAAQVPESIFALDIFGEPDAPGMIDNAAGGSLYIQNIDRLSEAMIQDVLNEINTRTGRNAVALYASVNVSPADFQVTKYRIDPFILPRKLMDLGAMLDAEIVVIEPLRDQDDLDVVAEFFRQKQASRANKPVDGFTPEAILALKSYAWPGNFSELRNVVERAVMRCEKSKITVADLGRDFEELADASTKNIAIDGTDVFRDQVQMMQALNETLQAQVERLTARNLELEKQIANPSQVVADDPSFLNGSFADIEKRLLARLLKKYQNDPDRTAEALNINRARFYSKLDKYHLIDHN